MRTWPRLASILSLAGSVAILLAGCQRQTLDNSSPASARAL
jgi:hypothetical protein